MGSIPFRQHGRDAESLRRKAGWEMEVVDFEPKSFRLDECRAHVPGRFEIVRSVIRGRVRMSAALTAPKLRISLVKTVSPRGTRLQGRNGLNAVVLISAEGNRWDGLTELGMNRIDVEFDEPLARKILSPDGGTTKDAFSGDRPSTLVPYGHAAKRLQAAAERILAAADPDRAAMESEEEIIEAAAAVLREASTTSRLPGSEVGTRTRRDIALEVEKRLWRTPLSDEGCDGVAQKALEESLGVSRRTIQSAVKEQFGVTFSTLRRVIRLTHFRRAVLRTEGRVSLGFIAAEYGLHPGRLAKEYYDLFGTRPSEERARFSAGYELLVMSDDRRV